MIRAVIHARTWLLAIICLTAFGACRRVTIISFHTDVKPAPDVDQLVVNLHAIGMKHSQQLNSLDEKLGLYDLPRSETTIDISAFGCFGGVIKMINDTPPMGGYSIVSDAVLVTMVNFPAADQDIKCPVVESDGGVSGEPSGTGGAVDSGSGGSGGLGGGAGSGIGGMGGGADAAGGSGGADAGRDMLGSGGNTGAGGCDDAGHETAVDARKCDQPADPPQPRAPEMPSPACIDYCNQIIGSADGGPPLCQGAYESIDQCQQYCAKAAWPAGSGLVMDDSMACRLYNLNDARAFGGVPPVLRRDCGAAGPNGGSSRTDSMACLASNTPPGMCTTFCNALTKICPANASGCLAACQSAAATEPACRFPWLVRAATDQRYCALVDYAGSCLPPGC